MIITLTGENTFAMARAERQIIDAFIAKHGANGVERIDGEGLDIARLPDLVQGATLFSPVRLVVLKNMSVNKALHEPLTEALEHASDDTTIVITDSSLDKRTKLYKFLKSKSKFETFAKLDEPKLTAWAQQEAERLGATLSRADALYLVQRTGHDQWRLFHELQKVASYNPQISRHVIDSLVEPSPEGSVFELLDAALSGQTDKVAQQLAALKTEEDPYKLFGLLASQTYALAVVAVAGARSPDTIAKEVGLHPFVVRKTQPLARRIGVAGARTIAKEVARCDWHLKSTGADPWHLLEATLGKIAKEV